MPINEIELGKTHLALTLNIFKVYENYVYLHGGEDNAIVIHFDRQDKIYKFKIGNITDSVFQSKINPCILSNNGIYNVFYPNPLVSFHYNAKNYDLSFSEH